MDTTLNKEWVVSKIVTNPTAGFVQVECVDDLDTPTESMTMRILDSAAHVVATREL
jgi:hypothetical protein